MKNQLEKGIDNLKGSVSVAPITEQNLLLLDKALHNTGGLACHVVRGWSLHIFMHLRKQWINLQLSKDQQYVSPNVKQDDFAFFPAMEMSGKPFYLIQTCNCSNKGNNGCNQIRLPTAEEKLMSYCHFEATRLNVAQTQCVKSNFIHL